MEKEDQDWGREGGRKIEIVTVCFTWAFHSAAKTIAPLESQISFHVRGPKARGGHQRVEAERSYSHTEMAEYNLCWYFHIIEALCGGCCTEDSRKLSQHSLTVSPLKRHWEWSTLHPPLLFPPVCWHHVPTHANKRWTSEVKWIVRVPGSAQQAFSQFIAIRAQIWIHNWTTLQHSEAEVPPVCHAKTNTH